MRRGPLRRGDPLQEFEICAARKQGNARIAREVEGSVRWGKRPDRAPNLCKIFDCHPHETVQGVYWAYILLGLTGFHDANDGTNELS